MRSTRINFHGYADTHDVLMMNVFFCGSQSRVGRRGGVRVGVLGPFVTAIAGEWRFDCMWGWGRLFQPSANGQV